MDQALKKMQPTLRNEQQQVLHAMSKTSPSWKTNVQCMRVPTRKISQFPLDRCTRTRDVIALVNNTPANYNTKRGHL